MSTQVVVKIAMALAVGVLFLGVAAPGRSRQGVTVQLFQFKPARIEVRTGTKLTWTNQDDIAHTATSGVPDAPDGRFDLPLAGKGATGVVSIKEPGVYPYFCSRHQSMRGEIRVR